MNIEIYHASSFLASLLVQAAARETAAQSLAKALAERFHGHFDLARPMKGQGFRCVHIDNGVPEPFVLKSLLAAVADVTPNASIAREQVALWIDPGSVVVRIGARPEHTVYSAKFPKSEIAEMGEAATEASQMSQDSDSESTSSSSASASSASAESSPADSPRSRSPIRSVPLSPFAAEFAAPVNA